MALHLGRFQIWISFFAAVTAFSGNKISSLLILEVEHEIKRLRRKKNRDAEVPRPLICVKLSLNLASL